MSSALVAAVLAAAQLDAIEAVNDELELRFDAVCSALKGGARSVPEGLAKAGAHPIPQTLVWVTSCSLRALKLAPKGDARDARFLFELEGRDATGARVIERGEADGHVRKAAGQWQLDRFEPAWQNVVRRESPRFLEVAGQVGLELPARKGKPQKAEILSGGLVVRDLNGDGRPEIVAADGPRLQLFTNVAGGARGYHFERTQLFEAPSGQLVVGAAAGDFDNDGDADLVVVMFSAAPAVVLKNEGGTFTVAGKLDKGGRLQSAIASDFDSDGNLDLAVLPYPLAALAPSNMLEAGNGEPLRLYRGDGKLGFTRWPLPAAVGRWSLAAVSADLLRLGRPQLYVANDFGSNDLYVFDADGGIRNVAVEMRLDDPGNGMSADVGDLDGDGRLDLYVANMFSKAGTRVVANAAGSVAPSRQAKLEKFAAGNTLYLARDDGGFEERASALGVNRGFWAFGSLMFDADDDGRLELAVADGYFSHPNRKDL